VTEWWQLALVAVAGAGAGFLNAVIGSGTLITFPTLLALGVPPLVANTSNSVGLVPGGVSAVLAGRKDLPGQGRRLAFLAVASLVGGIAGALLLLWLPPGVFAVAVPVLIAVGCVLVLVQPRLAARLAARRAATVPEGAPEGAPEGTDDPAANRGTNSSGARMVAGVTWLAVLGAGVYGGYFGAAQGVLLMGILGLAYADGLGRLNVVKNALGLIVNGVAAIVFVLIATVDWRVAVTVAVGSILGAQLGGRLGRRLPPVAYRVVIVAVGVAAIGHQVWQLAAPGR